MPRNIGDGGLGTWSEIRGSGFLQGHDLHQPLLRNLANLLKIIYAIEIKSDFICLERPIF